MFPAPRVRRLLFGTLLTFGLTLLGFCVAILVATEYVYPGPRDVDLGLARVSFAARGAFAGLLAGVVLGFVLKPSHIFRAAVVALVLGAVMPVLLSLQAARQRKFEPAAELNVEAAEQDPPPLPASGMDMLLGLVTVAP